MPTIIRQALFERVSRLPALREYLDNFRAASGIPVEFVGPLGHMPGISADKPACTLMQGSEAGRRHCTGCIHRMLEKAVDAPAHATCDSGQHDTAVPLKVGGQVFGYFVFGGYLRVFPDLATRNGIRHRLERLGIQSTPDYLTTCLQAVPVYDTRREQAVIRMLEVAAMHLSLIITDTLAHPEERLPPIVEKACALARQQFREPLSLASMARMLKVSPAHLCRTFHSSTGLPFTEYLARMRAEHARKLLLATTRDITDIAYDSGFQSISQFNRTFKSVHGQAPSALRKRNAAVRTPGSAAQQAP